MAIKILSLSYVAFVLLLILSSFFEGAIGMALYFVAFVIPIALAFLLGKKSGEIGKLKLKISSDNIILLIPAIAPTLFAIIGVAALFNFVLGMFGVQNENITDVSGNIFLVILRHALIPSILEELLFRYIPLALLLKSSPRAAIFASGVFFAFSHCNIFQLPYALFAGLSFALLDVIFDSITPSLLLHIMNNVISVFYLRYAETANFELVYFISLAALTLVSITVILLMRDKYLSKLSCLKREKERVNFGFETLIFLVITSIIAVITI